jgi:hypothetical protein
MKRTKRLLPVGLLLGLGSTLGCFPVGRYPVLDQSQGASGALSIFSKVHICPSDRVKVTPRLDVPPHTVLGPLAAPPPPEEIALDPARVRMWQNTRAQEYSQQSSALDLLGKTYQVDGCGKQVLYVCRHPSQGEYTTDNPYIVGDQNTTAGDGREGQQTVVSAVLCQLSTSVPDVAPASPAIAPSAPATSSAGQPPSPEPTAR